MSYKEPYIALGIAAIWGIYGAFYFLGSSKKKDKPVLVPSRA
jgi:basic amino acid/polyamine antiporter, APA family